jgi:hypothetical protein
VLNLAVNSLINLQFIDYIHSSRHGLCCSQATGKDGSNLFMWWHVQWITIFPAMSTVPATLPPQVLRFLTWLKATDGRDKLYRLVAYGSKIPIDVLKKNGGDKDTIARLTKGAKAIGLSRKMFRLFRSVQFLQDFLQSTIKKDVIERSLSMFKALSLTIW